MVTFLFVFFCGLIALLLFFGIRYLVKRNEKKKKDIETISFGGQQNNVLKTVYDIAAKKDQPAGMPIRKIKIIELLNIAPKKLQEICRSLTRNQMIEETETGISLTDFGAKHVEVFIKKDTKK